MATTEKIGVMTVKTTPRILRSRSKQLGIRNYDVDNAYPQKMDNLIAASVMGTTCVDIFRKFLFGQGFEDKTFGEAVVNEEGETINNLLYKCAFDYSKFKGFALHVNYNLLGSVVEISHIPFSWTRLKPYSEYGRQIESIAVYDDWNLEFRKRIDPKDVSFIKPFAPLNVSKEVEEAGSIEAYKGQVFWYSADGVFEYPLTPYDSAIEDIETDTEIKYFKNSNVLNQFLVSAIVVMKEKQEEGYRENIEKQFKAMQGGRNSAKLMVVGAETPEDAPEIKPFAVQNNDTLYQYHETSVQKSIARAFQIPPALVGTAEGGAIIEQKEVLESQKLYNGYTSEDRLRIADAFKKVTAHFFKKINPENNFNIIPFEIVKEGEGLNGIPKELYADLTQNERRALIGFPAIINTNTTDNA